MTFEEMIKKREEARKAKKNFLKMALKQNICTEKEKISIELAFAVDEMMERVKVFSAIANLNEIPKEEKQLALEYLTLVIGGMDSFFEENGLNEEDWRDYVNNEFQ